MAFISTSATVVLIDTIARSGLIFLPPTTQLPGRTLTIKDVGGNCQVSACSVSTVGSDLFEDLTATKQITSQYGFFQLTANSNRWYTGATNQVQSISTLSLVTSDLITSTVRANSTFVQTVQLPSNPLFVSSSGLLFWGPKQLSYSYPAVTPQVLFS